MTEIITMPEALYAISSLRFNPLFLNSESPPSPFNPNVSISGPSAVYWQIEMVINSLEGYAASANDLANMRRFLMKLRGGKVLARIYDMSRPTPRGAGGVSTTVNVKTGGAAGAESFTLKNLVVSQSPSLQYGDFFGLGENLHMIEDSADSDVNGEATVYFSPPARKAFAAGDAVQLSKPTGLFRISGGLQDLTMLPPLRTSELTLSFIEEPDFD